MASDIIEGMKCDYVSQELSKALKEAGFDWPCRSVWHFDGQEDHFIEDYPVTFRFPDKSENFNNSRRFGVSIRSAPTLYIAQKWLREIKGIAINVIARRSGKYHWDEVYLQNCNEEGYQWMEWSIYRRHPLVDTYEEALADGIRKMVELINYKIKK